MLRCTVMEVSSVMLANVHSALQRTQRRTHTECKTAAVGRPEGFSYEQRGREVVISHHGRRATTLRGESATDFLTDVERGDAQELMARLTGNYRRGNERDARRHPRNGQR